jgi:ParB family transcriptional regulator, chromosome partitioning protein
MSKRTDTIKSLFAAQAAMPLSADNAGVAPPRVTAGSVRSVRDTFSEVEKENEALRKQIETGTRVVEVDATLIDRSPLSDRLREDADTSFELLKQSIAQRGQEVPVLLRPHPSMSGRYQSAYGHRRIRAAKELGILVKAIIRDLSDENLVIAQGLENAPREDLSFIERAIFAMHIEDAGHSRSVIQDALSVDRAEASKLLAVARAIPSEIAQAIGKAPKVGRGRWQALAELFKDGAAEKRVHAAIAELRFRDSPSDARFLAVFAAAERKEQSRTAASREHRRAILSASGQKIGQARLGDRELKLTVDKAAPSAFVDFLIEQIPALFDAFSQAENGADETGA